MRIVINATGTWGDIRPNVLLGNALQKEGYEVLLISTEQFRAWIEGRGLAYAGIDLDIQKMMNAVMEIDGGPLVTLRAILSAMKAIRPAVLEGGRQVAAILRQGDVLLMNELVSNLLNGIIEKYNLRVIHINPQPQAITSQFPAIGQPILPDWMPMRGAYNRFSYSLYRRTNWTTQGSLGNQIRKLHLGMPAQTWAKQKALLDSTPSLVLASPHILPPPADWPPHHHVTGYLFDEESDWEAPPDLLDFLAAGEKPVYIGFGSMPLRKPAATTQAILEAVKRSGKRAILLSGWAGIGSIELPKEIFLLKYAPHSWLYPRVSAVVHHGGAGTTGAGLRAGLPSVIVPFLLDQFFWGQRLYELGVGTKPIPRRKLNADNLSAAIVEATTDRAMQDKAADLGRKIAAEDGLGEAIRVLKGLLS